MRILLDTNAWVWFVSGSDNLGKKARNLIESGKHEICLASISIWEVLLLGEKKRLLLEPSEFQWVEDALIAFPVIDIPLSRIIAITSRRIELPHKDPADRFILAAALYEELTLLTADEHLLANKAGVAVINASK